MRTTGDPDELRWTVEVVYRSREHGTLNCSFSVDDLTVMDIVLHAGYRIDCVVSVTVTPSSHTRKKFTEDP